MPVLFLGHGSPMNAIEDNAWRRSWAALGGQFGSSRRGSAYPRPQLILCISAHWLTPGWRLTGMARPHTIHDFGGFPQALFEVQYPAPGAPAIARALANALRQPATGAPMQVDDGLGDAAWGLDHGAWGVLAPMFPAADIPVIQLGMDYSRPLAEHVAVGQQLQALRERGVLIVGSGNIVHNLRAFRAGPGRVPADDWAKSFDRLIADALQEKDHAALCNALNLGDISKLAHPTHEHLLPLFYCAGAARENDTVRFFNEDFQAGSISMRSVIWSAPN